VSSQCHPRPSVYRRGLLSLLLPFLAAVAVLASIDDSTKRNNAPRFSFQIVRTYPHDPSAFTQGLEYRGGGVLLEGTGQYGSSDLRTVRLEDGVVLRRRSLEARYFGEGITLFRGTLFQLTWREQTGFRYDERTS
jgi:glutaminyl-peptide cyclotransferase